ncbi:cyclin-dependent kinase 9-like [Nasonia vitripennis]|uniref:Protein kinase domain-containing protein n=1 Tax=Nasonia vitripennis TaxID=7425 RepID=A0A7M7Q9V4_NASVI|nr:cyclin-dependent kinase 9-like [Nasonia vitripennis]
MALEFCEYNLASLLGARHIRFHIGEIKKLIYSMIDGLYYLHINKIMHRDLKPANVLIRKTGVLKIADFGLSRAFKENSNGEQNQYTNRVVTLWYRPPELLLGERNYGPSIDMWGAGCILAEMWTRTPILQGNSEQGQLHQICYLCGSITSEAWVGVDNLPLFNNLHLPKNHRRRLMDRLKPFVTDRYACDLLDKLLVVDPKARIDANQALDHNFF